jgi:hypothetical protein
MAYFGLTVRLQAGTDNAFQETWQLLLVLYGKGNYFITFLMTNMKKP